MISSVAGTSIKKLVRIWQGAKVAGSTMESAPPPDVGQAIKEGVKRMDVPDPLKTVLPDKNSGFNILSQARISLSEDAHQNFGYKCMCFGVSQHYRTLLHQFKNMHINGSQPNRRDNGAVLHQCDSARCCIRNN